jgi:uncharacterized protein
VDSSLLLKLAHDTNGARGVLVDSVFVPRREIAEAVKTAEHIGAGLEIITADVLSDGFVANNDKKRCYYCKKMVYGAIKLRYDTILDGQNADDSGQYRPGSQAAKEYGVVSPFAALGVSKAEIRQLSKKLGLPTWDKPANACLATRLPYDTSVSADVLANIERAEDFLSDKGHTNHRVRTHGNIARIEVPKGQFGQLLADSEIVQYMKSLGYKYITLDIEGTRSGSMD